MISPQPLQRVAPDVVLGPGVVLNAFINLYGCTVGAESKIGTFVEIQRGARIGKRCKISSHSFICEGVEIEDEVFIGHHVCFTNDLFPRATTDQGELKGNADWTCVPTKIGRRASIGSGSTLLCGVTIGEGAMIGAGSVVTKDVAPWTVVAGNPAQVLRTLTPPPTQ